MRLQRRIVLLLLPVVLALPAAAGCGQDAAGSQTGSLRVVASTTFLADIAQHVAGDRFRVSSLVPPGADPHSFEPAPSDLRDVADADLLIVNGAGLEGPLLDTARQAGSDATTVVASAGLKTRTPKPGEPPLAAGESDPHFWLDPRLVEHYVLTIRDAFKGADPGGGAAYDAAAAGYLRRLRRLDAWIRTEVAQIPPSRRLLVTDHSSYGYFADRYGLRVVGTVLPGATSGDTPSARGLADLTKAIRASGAPAIFVDAGENPQLARQIGAETGVTVVTDLLDHSLTPAGGVAPDYIAMIKWDVRRITEALR